MENGIAIEHVRGIAKYLAIKLRMAYKVTISGGSRGRMRGMHPPYQHRL